MLRSGKIVRTKKYARPRRDSDTSLDEDITHPTQKVSSTLRKVLKSTNRNYRRGRPRKVVVCDVCSKVFPNADDYNAHSFIHLGEEEIRDVENHAVSAGSRPVASKPKNKRKSVSQVSLQCPKSSKAGHFKQQKIREKSVHSTKSPDIPSAVSNAVVPTENCSSKLKQMKKKRKKSDSNAKPNDCLKKKKSKDNASREESVKKVGLFESLAAEVSEKGLVSGDLQDGDLNFNEDTKIAKKPAFSEVVDCVSPNASREKSSANISLSDSNVVSIKKSSDDTTHSNSVKSDQTDACHHSFVVENDRDTVVVPEPVSDVQSAEEVQNSQDNSKCEITSAESDTVCLETNTSSNRGQSVTPSVPNRHHAGGSELSGYTRENFFKRMRTAIKSSVVGHPCPVTPDANVSNDHPEAMNFTSKSRNFLKSKNSDSEFLTNVFRSYRTPVSSHTSKNRVKTSANQHNTEAQNPWVIRKKAGCDKIQPVEIAESSFQYPLHLNDLFVSADISNMQKNANCSHDRESTSKIHLNEPVVSANNSNTQPQKDLNPQPSSADACSQSLEDFTNAKVSSNDDINSSVRETMTPIENVLNCSQIHGEGYSTDANGLDQSTSEMSVSENDSFDDLPFECDWCGRTFKNNTLLTSHRWVHTACKRYVCRFCGRSFTSERSLREHSIVHKVPDAKSTSTAKRSRCASKGVKRNESEMEFSCSECGEVFWKRLRFVRHRKDVTCKICKITYQCRVPFLLHNRELHESACDICGETLFNNKYLRNHMKTHAAKRVRACIECGDVFLLRSELRDHFVTHKELGKHVCELCGTPFAKRVDRMDHKKNRHGRNRDLTQPRVTRSVAGDTDIRIKSLEDIAPTKIQESRRLDSRSDCGSEKNSNSVLIKLDLPNMKLKQRAERPGNARHVCKTCGIKCRNADELYTHQEDVHGSSESSDKEEWDPEEDSDCDSSDHADSKRVGEKHQCRICGKGYTAKRSLIRHMRISHREQQLF